MQGSFIFFNLIMCGGSMVALSIAYAMASICPSLEVATTATMSLVTILTVLSGFMIRESAMPVRASDGLRAELCGLREVQGAAASAPSLVALRALARCSRRSALGPPRPPHTDRQPTAPLPPTSTHKRQRKPQAFLRWAVNLNFMHHMWAGLMLNQFSPSKPGGKPGGPSMGGVRVLDYYQLAGSDKWEFLGHTFLWFGVWTALAWVTLLYVKWHRR